MKTVVLTLTLTIISALLVPPRTVACVQPPDGLIAWWPGDTDGEDISGNGSDAALQNGAQAGVPGKVGGSFKFDGVDDIAETSFFLPPQGTIDVWVQLAAVPERGVIFGTFGKANGDDRLWMGIRGQFRVNFGNRSRDDIIIPNPLSVGKWTHLAVTFNYVAGEYALYMNGAPLASFAGPPTAPTGAVRFGGIRSTFGQSSAFPGLIDEVEVFDRVLSPEEIKAIFEADSAGKCKPLQCTDKLLACEADLAAATADSDEDGSLDGDDTCPGTPSGEQIDQAGCSLEQFCSRIDVKAPMGKRTCSESDWQNDEPLMRRREQDCTVDRAGLGPEDNQCVPLVRCCLPRRNRTTCRLLGSSQCRSRGGTDIGSGSCVPNPCPAP